MFSYSKILILFKSNSDAVWNILRKHVGIGYIQPFVAGLDFIRDLSQPLLKLVNEGEDVVLSEALVWIVTQKDLKDADKKFSNAPPMYI